VKADDPFDLARFKSAQDGVSDSALAELRAGRKQTHWMWFVFPQLRGLGRSAMARRYGIASIGEARAYLADQVLSERLDIATSAVLDVEGRSARAIFNSPDDMKFHSSMTLFSEAAGDASRLFRSAPDAKPVEATYRRPYSSPSCRRLFGPWLRHHKNDIFTRKSPGMSPGLKVRPLRFSKLGERKSDEISSPCRRGAWPASVPSSSAVRPPSPPW
jgi:uncharacterized protein (DUF1810 family)